VFQHLQNQLVVRTQNRPSGTSPSPCPQHVKHEKPVLAVDP
jgi:hypothetical protein